VTRIVVSGLGAVSPFGVGVKAYWDGLASGRCAIQPLTVIETDGFRSRVGAEVPPTGVAGLWPSRRRARADRFALAAAVEALDDAGLSRSERAQTALVVGAVGGGMLEAEAWYWARARGVPGPDPRRALASLLPCTHAEAVGRRLALGGPRGTIVMACSSGAASLAAAADLIASGAAPSALAGGVDTITRICFMGFNALKLVDPDPCRVFDRDRKGMSIGEGAAWLVLESLDHARARGARVYAELAGHATTTDAYHPTAPRPDGSGMVAAMRTALHRAGLDARAVDYVNAHGTGTPQNDRIEAQALREVFGEGGVLVSSNKSQIGHTMAAAGSLEALATVLALVHGLVPATANLMIPDPDIPFDCVPRTPRSMPLEAAISNSFGFGGQNVTLALRRVAGP
jgi:3-oxoacyl-[acyl-carrier-protein] synthase II